MCDTTQILGGHSKPLLVHVLGVGVGVGGRCQGAAVVELAEMKSRLLPTCRICSMVGFAGMAARLQARNACISV